MKPLRLKAIFLIGIMIGPLGCASGSDRHVASTPARPNPKIIQHKVETHNAANLIMKAEMLPVVVELLIVNSGASGNVRIRVEEGQKSWEERAHFNAGQQRTVRISLPGAESGILTFFVEAD